MFEKLPEMGDLDKPRMVFFFDEAHMLFNGAPKNLLSKIEQVVKLIRSKGVGVYFITQSPKDIPDGVLSQLGNKLQHALHAYTPTDQKAVKAAAMSFRANPLFDTCTAIEELGIGEALVSVLDEKGVPTIVEKTDILPPGGALGVLDDSLREEMIKESELYAKYHEAVDRDSAYELLLRQFEKEAKDKQQQKEQETAKKQQEKEMAAYEKQLKKEQEAAERERRRQLENAEKSYERARLALERRQSQAIDRFAGNLGSALGRGIMGNFFKR